MINQLVSTTGWLAAFLMIHLLFHIWGQLPQLLTRTLPAVHAAVQFQMPERTPRPLRNPLIISEIIDYFVPVETSLHRKIMLTRYKMATIPSRIITS